MKRYPSIHILLFLLTFLTVLITGALQEGVQIFSEPWRIYKGLPFAFTLMGILLSHELSHFFASKKHHTEATLPYFLPAPPIISPIGTFGAFIKMKSPIITRKALIDIGASGPLAGFLLSVAATVVGLHYSEIVSIEKTGAEVISISLGDSLLFSILSRLIIGVTPEFHDILLHPVAFAGWIGFFVTSLNLIPIGQLDGGHIAYAFFGERHKVLSRTLVGVLLLLGLFYWEGWALWGIIMIVLGLRHPPVLYWERPLDKRRRFVGGLAVLIFIITFTPSPFKLI